jgi:hypothetical protein
LTRCLPGSGPTNKIINITAKMAPTATLLLYYVRPNGEIVADSITFNIDEIFSNKVRLYSNLKQNNYCYLNVIFILGKQWKLQYFFILPSLEISYVLCKFSFTKCIINPIFFIYRIRYEEFEDTKGAIRIRISKKNRQHNGQKKKYKRKNNDQ